MEAQILFGDRQYLSDLGKMYLLYLTRGSVIIGGRGGGGVESWNFLAFGHVNTDLEESGRRFLG